jgi:translocation and assembly module TamB
LAFLLAVIGGHPWILAWVLEGQLSKAGEFSAEKREVSFRRIAWSGVEWQGGQFEARAAELELGLLPRFWETWTATDASVGEGDFFATAQTVEIRWLGSGEASPEVDETSGAVAIRGLTDQIHEGLTLAEQWLPPLHLRDVRVSAAGARIGLPELLWNGQELRIEADSVEGLEQLEGWEPEQSSLRATRMGSGIFFQIHLQTREFAPVDLRGEVRPLADEEVRFDFAVKSEHVQAEAEAFWSGAGWRPDEVVAEGRAALGQLGVNLPEGVAEIDSTFEASLEGDRWTVSARQEGAWSGEDEALGEVPLTLEVKASGDREAVEIEALTLQAPWAQARLDRPLRLDLATLSPQAAVRLQWEFDAGQEAAVPLTGRGRGVAEIAPREGDLAGMRWQIDGEAELDLAPWLPEGVVAPGLIEFAAQGEGDSEAFCLEESRIESAAWGRIEGNACWERAAAGPLTGSVEGIVLAALLTPLLPEGVSLTDDLEWSAESVDGAKTMAWNVTLRAPALAYEPMSLTGSADLALTALSRSEVARWSLQFERDSGAVEIEGKAQWAEAKQWSVSIDRLEETFEGEPRWRSVEPWAVSGVSGADGNRLELQPLRLAREDGSGELRVGGTMNFRPGRHPVGDFEFALHDLAPDAFEGWWQAPNEQWQLVRLEGRAQIPQEGPLIARIDGEGLWNARDGSTWRLSMAGETQGDVLTIERLDVASSTAPWLRAGGTLPIAWVFGSGAAEWGRLQADRAAALDWQVEVSAREPLPPYLTERFPLAYENFTFKGDLSGSFAEPQGQFSADGAWLEIPLDSGGDTGETLRLENPRLQAELAAGAIEVAQLGFRLPGAAERAEASLRLEHDQWDGAISGATLDWLEALRLKVGLNAFPVAALGPFLPETVEPAGEINADIAKTDGLLFEGSVSWRGIQFGPLPNGMAPRDFQGIARLDGRALREIEAELSVSGRSVRLGGEVDLAQWPEPLFDLSLEAERLDLVRQLDLILRAKGDLRLTRNSVAESTRLAGDLELLDSLLLRDVRDFTRQGAAGVARRPPYFAVEAEPFNTWQLDIDITGERFMRVQTPIFSGTLSADFHLGGTLGEPVATGQAEVNEGSVDFPFASLPVQRGLATITIDEPHRLQLEAHAQGIAFGYDVSVDLTGSANDPVVLFGSAQGLSPDDVVLMLTAGSVPSSDRQESDSMRAGRLALYLGRDIFSTLLSENGEASKLEVRTTEGVSPFRKETQVIEYHFTEDWSVLGEYDEFGDYNVDAKWTIYRK